MARDEDTLINPMDTLLDTDFGPIPISPTGDFVPATSTFESEPIPEATEDNFICLRGPCRHYFEMVVHFAAGNTRGTLTSVPMLTKRSCARIVGYEVDLTEEVVYRCNDWDPRSKEEIAAREARREEYHQIRRNKEASLNV